MYKHSSYKYKADIIFATNIFHIFMIFDIIFKFLLNYIIIKIIKLSRL